MFAHLISFAEFFSHCCQIQEAVKRKLDQEKESERRENKEKQLREREMARLWMIQKNGNSLQQLKDDIAVERIQEQVSIG